MNLNKVVYFIYKHALSMIEPWDDIILGTLTVPQLTSDGFQIVASSGIKYHVGMKEFMGTIFVSVHDPMSNYTSMAHNQKEARAIYDEIVNTLLAT